MRKGFYKTKFIFLLIQVLFFSCSSPQSNVNKSDLKFYPYLYSEQIDIKSPFEFKGREYVLAKTVNGKFTVIDVTVENGKPYNYNGKVRGKGNQLYVDKIDFPTLAKTGLHSEIELQNTKSITGKSIAEITMRGRPMRMSGAGFMANDEDIISVLTGDNNLVKKMNLTHPDLAKLIFHYWNIIQIGEEIANETDETVPGIDTIYYNNKVIRYKVPSCKGWQYSIFEDSIWGECHLEMIVKLSEKDKKFINRNFNHLNTDQKNDFIERLTHLHTGEMAAYYIQHYGFYEGHTDYRADPIVLAYIFGLRTLEELYNTFDGKVYENIINHHVSKFE